MRLLFFYMGRIQEFALEDFGTKVNIVIFYVIGNHKNFFVDRRLRSSHDQCLLYFDSSKLLGLLKYLTFDLFTQVSNLGPHCLLV